MSITTNTLLRTSKCLDFHQKGDKIEIVNLLNRKKYLITNGIFQILEQFRNPKTTEEFFSSVATSNRETYSEVFSYLHKNELIIEATTDETCQIKLVDNTLYGFESFDIKKETESKIVFWGIPVGIGNSVDKGCGMFPDYVRHFIRQHNITLNSGIDAIDYRFISSKINFENLEKIVRNQKAKDWGDLYLVSGEYPSSIYNKIYLMARTLFRHKHIPFSLGGDHSVSYPLIRAASEQHKAFQVIQFDAHVDTYDNTRINSIYEGKTTHHHANFMSECLKLESLKKVVQVGIRGGYNLKPRPSQKQHIIWIDELEDLLNAKKSVLDPNLPTYITFDIDFLDPHVAPGTATPVANGFGYNETCKLFEKLLRNQHIIGVDFVEVNPNLDQQKRTLQVASNLMLALLNYIK